MGRDWHWSRPMSAARSDSQTPSGCMSGMLSFFDIHQLLFTTVRSPTDDPDPRHSPLHKGVEAPRNSLELDETAATCSSAGEENNYYYDVPLGIQLQPANEQKLNTRKSMEEEEEKRNSQSVTPRKPSVVGRLMGLDVLPDTAPSPVERKPKKCVDRKPLQVLSCNTLARSEMGTRSLPDSPRASSVRSWDADPRFSLQMNKEGCGSNEPSPHRMKPRRSDCLLQQDENKSPRKQYHAREIVKQVKDSISSRKDGDKHTIVSSRRTTTTEPEGKTWRHEETRDPSYPPLKIRFSTSTQKISISPNPTVHNVEAKAAKNTTPTRCKKASNERYTERIKKKAPSPETAKTTGSDKKKCSPISCSCPDQTQKTYVREQAQVSSLTNNGDPEFQYVRSILEHGGVTEWSGNRGMKWHSPLLPIDPIVFHQMELELRFSDTAELLGPLKHLWNRKLLFDLVEEILGDLGGDRGDGMLLGVWREIGRLPSADCRVIGDIERLVEGDLPAGKVRGILRHAAVAAEAAGIAREIEDGVFEEVVGEAAAAYLALFRGAGERGGG